MSLSVIIVNFNGEKFLASCIDSIQKHFTCDYEVIVVDNCSSDGSVELLTNNYSWVKLIKCSENHGFSKGNNIGAMYATKNYLLLLNNDTIINSSFDPLLKHITNDRMIGAIGCKIFYVSGRLQESIGFSHTWYRIIMSWIPGLYKIANTSLFRRTLIYSSDLYNNNELDVDWVSGACLLTRRSIWEKLSGLDCDYFMYVEDTDYCYRIKRLGFRVIYSSMANITHYEGSGRDWIGKRALVNTSASYLIYASKHYTSYQYYFVRSFLPLVFILRSMIYFIGWGFTTNLVRKEKFCAYAIAAWCILKGSRTHV